MTEQKNGIKQIEDLILKASYEFLNNTINPAVIEAIDITAEIKYNLLLKQLYSSIVFRLYQICKSYNVKTTIASISDQVVKNIEINNLIGFTIKPENGYLNVNLFDSFINCEINRITLDDLHLKQGLSEESIAYFEPFCIWYCINKIHMGFKYLWDKHCTNVAVNDVLSRELSIYLLYLEYKKDPSISDLYKLSEFFYDYDRHITGVKIPYSLYNAIELTLRKLIWKINQ